MSRQALLIWIVVALLAILVWLTVTGRLGRSRHGYAAATVSRRSGVLSLRTPTVLTRRSAPWGPPLRATPPLPFPDQEDVEQL